MRPGRALSLAIVFAAYVITARAGLALSAVSGFAAVVWAPTGISLVAMVAWGYGVWPAVSLAAAITNLLAGAPVPVAVGIAAGNTAEALAGTWMLNAVHFQPQLQRLWDVAALVVAGALSTLVSATLGVGVLRLGGIVPAASLLRTWRVWWVGDLMGDLVVAPLLLVAWSRPAMRRSRNAMLEGTLAAFAVLATVALVFWTRGSAAELRVPPHLLFPVLLAVTLRLGQPCAAAGNFLAAAAAILFTSLGYGPFVHSAGLSESLLQLQMLMGTIAVTTLVLGATVAERDRAVAAREEFLSVASHELRTPLTSLSLQLQMLARTFANGLAPARERVASSVHTALRQSVKLERLISDLLDVSRIRAHRLDLTPEEFDLGQLAEEVAAAYEGSFRAAGASLTVERTGDCSGFWDRRRLEQVIDNLLSNALKYGGGKPVDVAVRAAPARVSLVVRDSGIGVAPADRRRIFDRYERAISARRYGGLGLGLWIAREIVEAHRGTISVESEGAAGSTFVLHLPRSGARG